MKAREIPSRLKARVKPLGSALETLPATMLKTKAARRAAERVLGVLDRITDAADRTEVMKVVNRELQRRGADELVGKPLRSVRRELGKVAHPEATPAVGAAAKPMPEVIRAKGGKRLPAAVARRAVRRSGDDFKPKKGKK